MYCRIKPHASPLVRTPAKRIRSPALRLFPRRGASRLRGPSLAQHPSLTARTTGVSNTGRAPCFRGSASNPGGGLPWSLVARKPSADFTPGACRPPPAPGCQPGVGECRGHPGLSLRRPRPPSRALRPVTTSNALPAGSYRDCWHPVSLGLREGGARSPPRVEVAARPPARRRWFRR